MNKMGKRTKFLTFLLYALCFMGELSANAQNVLVTNTTSQVCDYGVSEPLNISVDGNERQDIGKDIESNGSSDSGQFTEATSELKELQKELKELQEEFKAEREKNKKNEKKNDPYSVKFGGFLALDAAFVTHDDNSYRFTDDAENVFEVRDVRFVAKGSGHGNLQFAAGIGFQESIKLYDNFIRFKDSEWFGDVTIGHFYVESGMESIEPAFEPVFICTDEGSSFFRMNRRLGVASTRYNANKTLRAFFGGFVAPAINAWPNRSYNDDPGLILNARLTATPILIEDEKEIPHEVLHFGGSYYWLEPTDDSASLSLKTRGHAWSGSNPYFINGSVSLKERSYSVSQAEIAYQYEGVATTAEGYVMTISNSGGFAYGTTLAARWCVTPGCVRTYHKEDARFSLLSMPEEALFVNYKNRSWGQGWGALEGVAKWEFLETNHVNFTSANPNTGTVNRSIIGANWWWNSQTAFAFNWEHAWTDVFKGSRDNKAKYDTCVLQLGVKF